MIIIIIRCNLSIYCSSLFCTVFLQEVAIYTYIILYFEGVTMREIIIIVVTIVKLYYNYYYLKTSETLHYNIQAYMNRRYSKTQMLHAAETQVRKTPTRVRDCFALVYSNNNNNNIITYDTELSVESV